MARPLLAFFTGLRFKVALMLVLCAGAFAAAVVARSAYELQSAYADQGELQALALARGFSAEVSTADLEDPRGMRRRLEQLRRTNPGVRVAAVYAAVGAGPVAIAASDPVSRARVPVSPLGPQMRFEYTENRPAGGHVGDLASPLFDRRRAVAGSVWISLDLTPLDRLLAERERTLALQSGGLALLLALLVTGLIERTMVAPLGRVGSAAHRIREGHLGTRLGWRRSDEIGTLARDFDGMADELEHSHGQLETQALTDPLTGLLNHRAFHDRLETDLSRAARERYSVTLIAFDLDYFKGINDRFGHGVGDEALRSVARVAEANLRSGDVCGRLGGDEFVIALSHAGTDVAEQVVTRMRAAVSRLAIGPAHERVTVSAGIAEFPRHAQETAALMRLADGAMYWSKRAGRDGWSVYDPQLEAALTPTEDAERARHDATQARRDAERVRDDTLAATVHALAKAVDARDPHTHLHSQRVAGYAATLARGLDLDPARVHLVRTAGVLHDVGKIGIPDAVLLKPGALDPEELEEMRRHSILGRDIVAGAGMPEIAEWVGHLHERVDGTGYPDGISGEDIPLESRILHAVDALEAMTNSRVYRSALGLEEALVRLEAGAGTQFDPGVTARLLDLVRSGELWVEGPPEAPAGAGLRT